MTTNNKNGISTANLLFEATQYFVNNLNAGLNKLEDQYKKIDNKINTPPRTEELYERQGNMTEKLDAVISLLSSLKNTFKSTLLYIKIFATAISIAIIVGGIIIYYGNQKTSMAKIETRIEERMNKQIEKHFDEFNKQFYDFRITIERRLDRLEKSRNNGITNERR